MKRIIDEVSWQEACNGIRCAECALRNNNGSCNIELYIRSQPIYVEAELDTTNDFAEWIDVNGDGSIMKCSKCGDEVCCKDNNFCPNCGADMRVKTDFN